MVKRKTNIELINKLQEIKNKNCSNPGRGIDHTIMIDILDDIYNNCKYGEEKLSKKYQIKIEGAVERIEKFSHSSNDKFKAWEISQKLKEYYI